MVLAYAPSAHASTEATITERRQALGLTTVQLSRAAKLSPYQLGRYERTGVMPEEMAARIDFTLRCLETAFAETDQRVRGFILRSRREAGRQ